MEHLLRERPAGWFDDYDEMLLRAFVDAVEEGRGCRAAIRAAGNTATICGSRSTHPVVHELPLVGKYFDIGPVPMSGDRAP